MKICGNGTFRDPADRGEKSIRFAMAQKEIDAVVIGFKSRAEIDEAIATTNRVKGSLTGAVIKSISSQASGERGEPFAFFNSESGINIT